MIIEFALTLTVFLAVHPTLAQSPEITRGINHIRTFLNAADSGDTARVAESLDGGIDVNVTDPYGQTALMVAADQGHIDTVKLLLQRGARLNLQNRLGGAALMLASFNGHIEVVTELLKAGADVNAEAKNGATALIQAAVKPNEAAVQIINLLLDQKAYINAQDKEGYTALMRAVDHPPPPPPLPPFLKGAKKPKWYDKNQREAEIHLMVVKTLVMSGADLDLKDQRGRTALEIARMNHQTRISEFLESR